VANLPPEVHDTVLCDTMSKYGGVKDIKEEQWSRQYRYSVSNGIWIVEMNLKTHVPSHLLKAGTECSFLMTVSHLLSITVTNKDNNI
jgi:hypothetical protein